MKIESAKGFAFAALFLVVELGFSTVSAAGTLRRGSLGGAAASVTGSRPGPVLWTHYEDQLDGQFCPGTDPDGCNHESINPIIRLINPNGSANPFLAGGIEQPVCAMIYVFDDDEEMGECCGCLVTSSGLMTISVHFNLLSNWGLSGGPEGGDHGEGPIAIVAAAPNGPAGTCNPSNVPGYTVTTANNLLGSISHVRAVAGLPRTTSTDVSIGMTEVGLFDDGGGDPTNLVYLQTQCGAITGNGSGGALCRCPTE